jgi:hypothetical protein
MDQWLRRGSLSKRSTTTTTTTTVSTDVIDIVTEYQHFPSPSSIGSSWTAKISTKHKCNESYLSLGFTQTGGEIANALCVSYNKVLPDSPTLPAKLLRYHGTKHPQFKDKGISFFQAYLWSITKLSGPYGEKIKNWYWKYLRPLTESVTTLHLQKKGAGIAQSV